MIPISDRRRVELAVVPRLFALWVRGAIDLMRKAGKQAEAAGLVDELERLMLAENEAMDGADPKRRAKMEARVNRIGYAIMAPGPNMTRAFVALAVLVNDLIDDGHFAVVKGGNFDLAYEALKGGILSTADRDAEIAGLLDRVDRSATRTAGRMREQLDREGLFQGKRRAAA